MTIHASGDNRNGYVVVYLPDSGYAGEIQLVGLHSSREKAEARAWRDAVEKSESVDKYVIFAVPLDIAHEPISSYKPDADIRLLEAQEGDE